MLWAFGAFMNFALYNCFMRGIYIVRNKEVLNTRSIPMPLRVAISTFVTYLLC